MIVIKHSEKNILPEVPGVARGICHFCYPLKGSLRLRGKKFSLLLGSKFNVFLILKHLGDRKQVSVFNTQLETPLKC